MRRVAQDAGRSAHCYSYSRHYSYHCMVYHTTLQSTHKAEWVVLLYQGGITTPCPRATHFWHQQPWLKVQSAVYSNTDSFLCKHKIIIRKYCFPTNELLHTDTWVQQYSHLSSHSAGPISLGSFSELKKTTKKELNEVDIYNSLTVNRVTCVFLFPFLCPPSPPPFYL